MPLYVLDAGYDEAPLTWDLRDHLDRVQVLVPKQARRSEGLDAVVTSLYAKGVSVRDIARHVRRRRAWTCRTTRSPG